MGLRGKTQLPTLANRKGDAVYTKDKDTKQHEIPPHITIDRSKTEETHHGKRWSGHTFNKVDWTTFETAFKRLSKNRQTAVNKSCHNLWHTGNEMGKYIEARNHVASATRRTKTGTTSFHAGH
jgi:hypothetical protein